MKKISVLLLVMMFAAFGVTAKNYNLPSEEPVASVKVPDSWDVEVDDGSLSATSDDESIAIWMDVLDEDQLEGAYLENIGYLKKHKVKINEKSEEKTTGEINGLKTICYAMTGKDEDGVCNISLIFVRLSDTKLVSILYWAPEKVTADQLTEIKGIVNSIKKK